MKIVSIKNDGTVTVEMSAQEAADVRADLGYIPFTLVTKSGNQLHSLLEWATPNRAAAQVKDGLDSLFRRLGPPTAEK
ncbi:hypothetical protein [Streptomyces sp. NPDC058466]|uniref:hypothetical protein n=1 Tax=Streptomyces sp. NPDC058466 TaxID=3346512 RepID=UPI00364695EE